MPRYSYVCHEDCCITFTDFRQYKAHHDSEVCNPPRRLMCEGCPKSTRIFLTIHDADQHIHNKHEPDYHASCTMCGKNFMSEAALERHIVLPCVDTPPVHEYKCDIGKCKRKFESEAALNSHTNSARHKHRTPGLKCFGEGCRKTFNNPSAMLAHLESGTCVCGATRNSIRRVLMDSDKTGIITDVKAIRKLLQVEDTAGVDIRLLEHSRPVTPVSRSRASSVIDDSSIVLSDYTNIPTPSEGTGSFDFFDDDIHHEGGVYLRTPAASSAASSGVLIDAPRYSDVSNEDDWSFCHSWSYPSSEVNNNDFRTENSQEKHSTVSVESDCDSVTSDHTEVEVKPYCTLCTDEQRQERGLFPNMKALEQHLDSVYHAPAIYHCPKVSFIKGLNGTGSADIVLQENHHLENQHDKTHKRRSFKTLQGLAAHVESNACKGGKGMFKFAMDFLRFQLEGMGLKGKLYYKGIEE